MMSGAEGSKSGCKGYFWGAEEGIILLGLKKMLGLWMVEKITFDTVDRRKNC